MAAMTLPLPSTPSIRDEVKALQSQLDSRLASAIVPSRDQPLPTIPLIDLSPSFSPDLAARRAVAREIRSACLSSGFFQISGHGIPDLTCSGMLDQASRFFHTLTRAQKESLHISNNSLFRGWEPDNYTYASASKDDPSQAEHKEAFNWGYEEALDPSGGDGQYVDLNGSSKPTNQWPDENALPGFYAGVREYYGQVLMLARHLFRLFALSLDLEERFFDSMTTHPGGIGRLVWYPALSDSEEKDQGGHTSGNDADDDTSSRLGLGAHTDYECFTLLLSSANPGLEILLSPSPATPDLHQPVWISCPVRPGTLTVNVADFLQRWTGGLYKSTVHRVVMRKRREERFSVPFFFSVNYDAKVGVLDLEGRDGTDRTEDKGKASEIRAGEWVLERLRATV